MSQTKAQLIDPVDGSIVNADINASAAIAGSKISPSFTDDITIADASPSILFNDDSGSPQNPDYKIQVNSGEFVINDDTNSATRLLINSSGNVGIGTTSPATLLHLKSSSADCDLQVESTGSATDARLNLYGRSNGVSQIRFGDEDDTNVGLLTYDHTSNYMMFRTADAERMRIDSSGKVGIGVTSTGAHLQIHEGSSAATKIRVTNTTTGTSTSDGFEFGIGSGEEAFFNMKENAPLKFLTNGIERMRIFSDGKTAIGTSTSNSSDRFTIVDPGDAFMSIRSDAQADGNNQVLDFAVGTANRASGNLTASIAAVIPSGATAGGTLKGLLKFSTNSGDNIAERMRITSAGRLLINDDSSTNGKLVVVDTANQIALETGTSGDGRLNIGHFNNGTFIGTYGDDGGAADLIRFGTHSGDERMRIQSDGKVGIGTSNPQRLLHSHEASSGANYHVFTNTTTGSSGTDGLLVGISADEHALLWYYENEPLRFATNNTEHMRITRDGLVGIGTDSPDQKLVVTGSGTTILKVQNTDDGTAQITLGNVGSVNLGIKQNSGETAFELGGTEKMRIRGDGLCIGTTTHSANGNRLTIQATSSENLAFFEKLGTGNKSILNLQHGRATGSTVGNGIIFRNSGGTNVGEIEITNTEARTVGFSDYRMKENITDITNAINSVKNLAPKTFNYIQDETKKVLTGFIAHEVQAVLPQAVTGDKDAVVTQALINSDDVLEGEVGDPIYQKICITDLIPTLTAALKEAITKIETLETKVAALEAA